ncbi:hypothetical protein Btru_028697 [Bulinus truncatus]|nr:hypothetical protein Btru_028697 [Bulinus truncatus]
MGSRRIPFLLVLTVWASLVPQASQNTRNKRQILSDQPTLITQNGHLIIQSGTNHNITFRSGGSSDIYINNLELNSMASQVNSNSLNIVQLTAKTRQQDGRLNILNSLINSSTLALNSTLKQVQGTVNAVRILSQSESNARRQIESQIAAINQRLSALESTLQTVQHQLTVNDCANGAQCLNGGTCIDLYQNYYCICPSNWQGQRCETDVNECQLFIGTVDGCKNGATCINSPGSYTCQCTHDWYGVHCTEQHDDCQGSNSQMCGHGRCIDLQRTQPGQPRYTCTCFNGYTLSTTSLLPECVDVDECSPTSGHRYPCSTVPHVNCINVPGSFYCGSCPQECGLLEGEMGSVKYPQDYNRYDHDTLCTHHITTTQGKFRKIHGSQDMSGDDIGLVCHTAFGSEIFESLPTAPSGEPSAAAECGEPSTAAECGEPSTAAECGEPSTAAECGEPSTAAECGEPSTAAECGDPSTAAECGEPSTAAECGEPSTAAECGEPSTAAECGEPSTAAECGEPSTAAECGEPSTAAECGEPSTAAECGEPSTAAECVYYCLSLNALHFQNFSSPKYPSDYPHNVDCIWRILAPPAKRIRVDFLEPFFIEPNPRCMFDYIQFHDGGTAIAPVIISIATCGGRIRSRNGTITSPNYPLNYNLNVECEWEVIGTVGHYITFTFETQRLSHSQPCLDFVEIRDGNATDPVIYNSCIDLQTSVDTSDSRAYVKFKSGGTSSSQGFKLNFQSSLEECGGHLYDSTGTIMSPNFPNQFDYVQVSNGIEPDSPSLGRFCGEVIPPVLQSTGNTMKITFKTDISASHNGFRAVYTSDNDIVCGGTLIDSSGIITSPVDNSTVHKVQCIWHIHNREFLESSVRLSFLNFDLEAHRSCDFDVLEIREGVDRTGQLVGRYCGNIKPDDIVIPGGDVWIMYKTDSSIVSVGFNLMYNVSDCGGYRFNEGTVTAPTLSDGSYTKACVWKIQAPEGYRIKSNELRIKTIINGSLAGQTGYNLQYTFESRGCGGLHHGMNGTIMSPNYPRSYPHDTECTWEIHIQQGYYVNLQFNSLFDMAAHDICEHDFVQVLDVRPDGSEFGKMVLQHRSSNAEFIFQ